MIEQPPKITPEIRSAALGKLDDATRDLVYAINDEYLYWSSAKYKKADNMTPVELWACVKTMRDAQSVRLNNVVPISFLMTNKMHRICHELDLLLGGYKNVNSMLPEGIRERILISSLMEEAVSSSMMEGAATTRKVAKEMLKAGKKPRSHAEQMIVNNYDAIHFLDDHKEEPMSADLLKDIHRIMTRNTLENPEEAGRFRTNDDVVVENSITHEVVHTPPSYTEIEECITSLCDFFNSKRSDEYFVHPIVRGIIIHYLIAYLHPFVDGNGRTARALFYWYMLKYGYWTVEYLSISRIIYQSKKSYEKSFLFSEADGNDIGYFIYYNLNALLKAGRDFDRYIQSKTSQLYTTSDYLTLGFNERQAAILSKVERSPGIVLTVKALTNQFGVSHPTIQHDINQLVERKLLERVQVNRVKSTYIKGKDFDSLKAK